MRVKIHAKVPGIPAARASVSRGEESTGTAVVVLRISALDSHDFPSVVATLRLSLEESETIEHQLAEARRRMSTEVTPDVGR